MERNKMRFEQIHPAVCALYLIGIMVITMLTMHPLLIFIAFMSSFFYMCHIERKILWRRTLFMALPIMFFSMIVMPLFYHNGVTPLFYINDMPVTLETILHGFAMSMLLVAVMQWFQVWNVWIDSEKFLYLFGRVSPSLALLISMVFRFIPLMFRRWQEIREAQKGMGYIEDVAGIMDKARQFIKELSILVSWSLENSIDTSISMSARGYGIGKRTSFHMFRWHRMDIIILGICILNILPVIYEIQKNGFQVWYFPGIIIRELDQTAIIAILNLCIYLLIPVILEVITKIRLREKEHNNGDFRI